MPNLRHQELAESDIKLYVEDKLVKNLASKDSQRPATLASEEMCELVEMVVNKAEGVFLWVRLAIESLLRGSRKDDDWGLYVNVSSNCQKRFPISMNTCGSEWHSTKLSTQRKLQPIFNISGDLAVVP
ncbi:uncharacterized protein Z519_08845 [Cladophialophora bantiana CBS 173.52]|uniref:Uncharacterized protein n=1 Tax=Cladophialophora bantiana (strain ATCC 10958 / CBS 173.52 / CDC B-1940 / NIH 8579) TaxID=1442370 RepID=A0A0D2EJI1_CLAB1|nr:uncharacterized protein Z519_08845 [Cladophialophora bantiana CBS 173.52]KIW90201.1 hypothetical protein Z519_08845 [Cladophialophora bantiana CBS 173.52]